MRISEQSPNGVNGFNTLFDESEQLTPWPSSLCAAVTPRRTLVSSPRPMRKRSVAGNTVTATPAAAMRAAVRAKCSGAAAESLVTWPTVTRPP